MSLTEIDAYFHAATPPLEDLQRDHDPAGPCHCRGMCEPKLPVWLVAVLAAWSVFIGGGIAFGMWTVWRMLG